MRTPRFRKHASNHMSFTYKQAVTLMSKDRDLIFLEQGMNLVEALGFNGDAYELPLMYDALLSYEEIEGYKCSMHLWDSSECEVWIYYINEKF